MRNHKLKVLSMGLLLLSGCSNTGNSGGTGAVPTAEEAVTLENPIRLDQLGVLPASNSSAASYLLQLTNYSKDKYTLDSVRVIDLDTGKDSKLVSVASQACSTVSANGSCSIQLTPHTSQSADVKLEVNLKDKLGVSTKLVQLIRVSGELSSNNGGIVMLNDVDRIVTEDGNYSLSIPVVLGESYDDIKASNGSLICNTDGYQKGSSCTYQVSGKVSGTSAVVSTRLEGIKAGKTATVQEANTKVDVAKGAHLLLSHGTKIEDPDTSGEITVFNNGNILATGIAASIENNSGLEITAAAASNCQTTLAANDTCKVKVKVKSTTNGQGSVKVAYKDEGNDNTAQTNVRYKVANAVAGVVFTESSNNLSNAIIGGKTREAIINVKNTGNRTLEGVSYYLAPAGSSGLTVVKGAANGCNLTGATLTANESCNLSVKYAPSVAFNGSKSINLVINGKYIDQNGQSHSLISARGLTYSASKAGSGNLVWRATTGNGNLSIINDGVNVESATWELKNTLALDENLPAKAVNVDLVTPSAIDGLTLTSTNSATCPLTNANIVGNSACQYKVSYGPTRVEQNQTDVDIKAAYNFYAGTPESSSAKFKVASSAAPQPKIDVTVTMNPTTGTTVSGDGKSAASAWGFTAYHNKTISLKYEFKNNGSLKAEKFNLDVGNLPRGTALKDTNCKTGTNAESDLALGASCIANIDIPEPELFNVPNLIGNNLNSATLKLDLPYSYNYKGKVYRGQGDSKYVKFSRLWANVQHTIQATSSTESAYEFDVKTDVTGLDTAAQSYPITVTPTLANPIAGVMLTPCTIINASTTSCINKISLPKNMFVAGKTLIVTFKTSANSMNPNDAIVSSNEVGSTVVAMHNQTELVNAFKGDTSGKLFLLENDIALTGNWTPVAELKNAIFEGQGHKITNLNINKSIGNENNEVGMFKKLQDNVTIKNLSLQGTVITNTHGGGTLAAIIYGKNVQIVNSNFSSEVTGRSYIGGVAGSVAITGDVIFESLTVISKVNDKDIAPTDERLGGLVGSVEGSTIFRNIRINAKLFGGFNVGGLAGAFYNKDTYVAENIIAVTEIISKAGGKQLGGIFGATRGIKMSNIDATVNIKKSNAQSVGGILGQISWEADKDKLSNVIARGKISTSVNPVDSGNRISGIASAMTKAEVNRAIDMTTVTYNNGTTTANYVNPLPALDLSKYVNSGNVFYFLPAGATYITAANPTFVAGLTGATAAEQKTFLMTKGFDFTNTWTIKTINNVETIGIKEDSIPQFPTW